LAVHMADAMALLALDFSPVHELLDDIEQMLNEIQAQIEPMQQQAAQSDLLDNTKFAGFHTIPGSIRSATSPTSPSGRGFSLGEDIGATLRLVAFRIPGPAAAVAGPVAYTTGGMLLEDTPQSFASSVLRGVDDAVSAGFRAAEAFSPSQKSAREIGGPIMAGATKGVTEATPATSDVMTQAIDNAFNDWTGKDPQPFVIPTNISGDYPPPQTAGAANAYAPQWAATPIYRADPIPPPPPPAPLRPQPTPRVVVNNSGTGGEYEAAVNRGIVNAMRYRGAY